MQKYLGKKIEKINKLDIYKREDIISNNKAKQRKTSALT